MGSRGAAARQALQDQPRVQEFTLRAEPGAGTVDCTTTDVFDAWLHRLGPSPTLLYWRLANLSMQPDGGPSVVADEMAAWAGLAPWAFWKAIDRLMMFGRVSWVSWDVLAVQVTAPPAFRRTVQGDGRPS